MSYTPTVWQNGDTITEQKMNKLENGVASASGVLVVNEVTDGTGIQLNKTWNEINTAISNGVAVLIAANYSGEADGIRHTYIADVMRSEGYYIVQGHGGSEPAYSTTDEDGYPIYEP